MSNSNVQENLAVDRLIPPYLKSLADFLQSQLPDAWQWMHSDRFARDDVESIRLELLRTAVRLDRQSHARPYEFADLVSAELMLEIPVTLYQLQNPSGWNAAAMPVTEHAHLLFEGPVLKELGDDELVAVLAHELAHVLLWRIDDGRHRTALRLLDALCDDSSASAAHLESDRLRRLHTEIFCDRVALFVVKDPLPAIASLIKVGTQAGDVDPIAYLKQADEIFAAGKVTSEQVTHPELFIRARALKLWSDSADAIQQSIDDMLAGDVHLDCLDLMQRDRVGDLTRRTIEAITRYEWFRTDAVLSHARLYFDDFKWKRVAKSEAEQLASQFQSLDASVKQYFAYVLLDFATSDRELDDLPLAAAIDLAEQLSIIDAFKEIACKELRLRVKQWNELTANRSKLLQRAEKGTKG
ncbi:MAG: hypothetical protein R3C05_02135 [Pirellulaceae bacterium]